MSQTQTAVRCDLIRGGTSRAAYIHASDLPADTELRNRVVAAVMGGPDTLQVDGIGGGHPLTSKVAIIGPPSCEESDVDYLFLQVNPHSGAVSDSQNCGNILAGVGPFAIEHGLVDAREDQTTVRVHMVNSGNRCELVVPTPVGVVEYVGTTAIDGVPGTAAPIVCNFLDIAGSATGALLPTGNVTDTSNGTEVTCVDNGMPVVLIRAADIGCSGTESPDELDANEDLKVRLESIRLDIGKRMNLGDVSGITVPKICLVSRPKQGGMITTRTFIPHVCHRAIGVLGAVSVATGCLLEGSVAQRLAEMPGGREKVVDVEHPSGALRIHLDVDEGAGPDRMVRRAGVVRTARVIMRGHAYVSRSIWSNVDETD